MVAPWEHPIVTLNKKKNYIGPVGGKTTPKMRKRNERK
jgi:hypothetical protein